MDTLVDFLGGAAGYGAGVIYEFILSLNSAIVSGNHAEAVRLISTLGVLWITYRLIRHSLGAFVGLFKVLIKFTALVRCFFVALDVYHNGLDSTMKSVRSLVGSSAGYSAGVVHDFVTNLRLAIMKGDRTEALPLIGSLIGTFIAYKLVRRYSSSFRALVVSAIQLILITGAFFIGINIYYNGLDETSHAALTSITERSKDLKWNVATGAKCIYKHRSQIFSFSQASKLYNQLQSLKSNFMG